MCRISLCECSFRLVEFWFGHLNQFHSSLSVPWNTSTPGGYTLETVLNVTCGGCYSFLNGVVVVLFISMCLHNQAFHKMFEYHLRQFNCQDKNRNDRDEICKLLIEFYNSVRGWETPFSPCVFFQCICSTKTNGFFSWFAYSAQIYSWLVMNSFSACCYYLLPFFSWTG